MTPRSLLIAIMSRLPATPSATLRSRRSPALGEHSAAKAIARPPD